MTIEEEQRKYCDLVQFDFHDSYLNITLDTVNALKFALGVEWPRTGSPDFVIIADDDTYINLPQLKKMLFQDNIIFKVCSTVQHRFQWFIETSISGGEAFDW